jgi:hypothetical protein
MNVLKGDMNHRPFSDRSWLFLRFVGAHRMVTTRSRSAAVAAGQIVPEQRKAIAQHSQPATKDSDNPFDAKDIPKTPDLDEHSETFIESGDDQVSSKSVSDAYDALSEHDISDASSSENGDGEDKGHDEDVEDGADVEDDQDADIERVKEALAASKTDKHTWEDFPGEVKVSLHQCSPWQLAGLPRARDQLIVTSDRRRSSHPVILKSSLRTRSIVTS